MSLRSFLETLLRWPQRGPVLDNWSSPAANLQPPKPLHTAQLRDSKVFYFRTESDATAFLATLQEREAVVQKVYDPGGPTSGLDVHRVQVRLPEDDGACREL